MKKSCLILQLIASPTVNTLFGDMPPLKCDKHVILDVFWGNVGKISGDRN